MYYKIYLRLPEKCAILSLDEREYVQDVITKRKPHEMSARGVFYSVKGGLDLQAGCPYSSLSNHLQI